MCGVSNFQSSNIVLICFKRCYSNNYISVGNSVFIYNNYRDVMRYVDLFFNVSQYEVIRMQCNGVYVVDFYIEFVIFVKGVKIDCVGSGWNNIGEMCVVMGVFYVIDMVVIIVIFKDFEIMIQLKIVVVIINIVIRNIFIMFVNVDGLREEWSDKRVLWISIFIYDLFIGFDCYLVVLDVGVL